MYKYPSVNLYSIKDINKGYTNLDLIKEGIALIGTNGKQEIFII